MQGPEQVVDFWLNEVGQKNWYFATDEINDKIRTRFGELWQTARDGGLMGWMTQPQTALAYLIVTDQFPRNIFAGHPESFATDKQARAAAKQAVDHEFDLRVPCPQRQFFYMPLVHSECLTDQDRGVRLICKRLDHEGAASNLLHAKAHREVIRRYGRFPTRNAALGRTSTDSEQAYLDAKGYQEILNQFQAA